MWAVPRLCEFYPGICLTTEEKARRNLSQGKKNLSQVKKNLSQVKKNLSQGKENLSQVKKNLSQSAVYILPKTPTLPKTSRRGSRTALGPTHSPTQRVPGLFPAGIQRAWHVDDHSSLFRTVELCLLSTYNFMVCVCKSLHPKANGLCCSMHGLHEHYIITGCMLERMTPRHRINEVLKCMSVLYVMDWKSITCSECVCVVLCV